ncbi:MAG: Panacea domain-containing protein [Dehalococcoidia bacterium]
MSAPPKLVEAITYVVEHSPRPPGRTLLQKLLYLSDVESVRRTGRSVTGLDYIAYDHGPWLPQLYDALALAENLRERRYLWSRGQGYEYELAPGARPRYSLLTDEDRQVLQSIASTWGRRPLEDVLAHVYEQSPYEGTPFGAPVPLA